MCQDLEWGDDKVEGEEDGRRAKGVPAIWCPWAHFQGHFHGLSPVLITITGKGKNDYGH